MRRWLFVALVLAGAALLTPAVTHAQSSPQTIPASGTFVALGPPEVLSSQTVDGVTFLTQRVRLRLTGTLTGTVVTDQRLIILPNGTATIVGEETFTGTVAGRSGTLRLVTVSTVVDTTIRGQISILGGTGGLANLRGQLSAQGSIQTGTGTYTGVVQFGP